MADKIHKGCHPAGEKFLQENECKVRAFEDSNYTFEQLAARVACHCTPDALARENCGPRALQPTRAADAGAPAATAPACSVKHESTRFIESDYELK